MTFKIFVAISLVCLVQPSFEKSKSKYGLYVTLENYYKALFKELKLVEENFTFRVFRIFEENPNNDELSYCYEICNVIYVNIFDKLVTGLDTISNNKKKRHSKCYLSLLDGFWYQKIQLHLSFKSYVSFIRGYEETTKDVTTKIQLYDISQTTKNNLNELYTELSMTFETEKDSEEFEYQPLDFLQKTLQECDKFVQNMLSCLKEYNEEDIFKI